MSEPDLRFVKFWSLCCFWFSWRENDFDTCVGSLGDDGATNHHCQHRHCHQLQIAVTWVLDELQGVPKKKSTINDNNNNDNNDNDNNDYKISKRAFLCFISACFISTVLCCAVRTTLWQAIALCTARTTRRSRPGRRLTWPLAWFFQKCQKQSKSDPVFG